jgi:hypothetical protein
MDGRDKSPAMTVGVRKQWPGGKGQMLEITQSRGEACTLVL